MHTWYASFIPNLSWIYWARKKSLSLSSHTLDTCQPLMIEFKLGWIQLLRSWRISHFLTQVWTLWANLLQKTHLLWLYGRLGLLGVGLAVFNFIGRFQDLVVTAAVVWLLGPACGAGGTDTIPFHSVLGAILVLQISFSSIASTTGSGVVDGPPCL